jgi:hypothetical protein
MADDQDHSSRTNRRRRLFQNDPHCLPRHVKEGKIHEIELSLTGLVNRKICDMPVNGKPQLISKGSSPCHCNVGEIHRSDLPTRLCQGEGVSSLPRGKIEGVSRRYLSGNILQNGVG